MADFNNSELVKAIENNVKEKIVIAHAGTQVVAGGRSSCAVALVECERGNKSDNAIFIFSSESSELVLSDLTLDQILPIGSDFVCDIAPLSSGSEHKVVLKDGGGLSVVLELPANAITDAFVSEIYGVIEKASELGKNFSTWTSGRTAMADSTTVDQVFLNSAAEKDGQTSISAREDLIKHLMDSRAKEFTYTVDIKILVATYNVNGKPVVGSLVDWLTVDSEPPDIYVVGFQELDLSKETFLFNETQREGICRGTVTNTLATRHVIYEEVCLVRLVGMMLIVYVRESHREYVRNVASFTVGTGIMGRMGNKGGVGARLDFHSTSICFVNSHLAAHVEEYERRNQDFSDITAKMLFTTKDGFKYSINDHDQVYWLGDLNYRVTNMDVGFVKLLLLKKDYAQILKNDQLNLERKKKAVFEGYTEGPINFHPTYKYDTGTDHWDSSEKHRAPAWCDRVLWKGDGITQMYYRSHPSVRLSDHKPVSSLFTSQVRLIDIDKQRKVHEDVIKRLDKLENEFLPQVDVDTKEVIFDTVRFLEPVSHELIIENTGQVPAKFEFINKLDDVTYCKPWLRISPSQGFISVKERCDVKLEVLVDKHSAWKLNSGEDTLYDILVLHLDGGKDIFITVTGNYMHSCFGTSIEALVRIPIPIRELSLGELKQLETNKEMALTKAEPYPIPKEVWFLVDHLYRHGLKQPLFVQPGLRSEMIQIRNWLDNGSSDPLPGSPLSMAEALLHLLESTAEPVIPYNLLDVCINSSSAYRECKQLVQTLPAHRRNVFLYICVFLQELLAHSSENDLEAKVLATLFGRIFLRDPPSRRNNMSDMGQFELDKKKCNFVYHFLVNDQTDFILESNS